ncbi:hypothetical protein BDZ97DRAFT_1846638 [Flammula alnicola]|nr:hypothetical protein BDZ97DRAFT_1846638 [Flammula alnicola]
MLECSKYNCQYRQPYHTILPVLSLHVQSLVTTSIAVTDVFPRWTTFASPSVPVSLP